MAAKKESVQKYKVVADAITGLGKKVPVRGDIVTKADFLPGHFEKYVESKHIELIK